MITVLVAFSLATATGLACYRIGKSPGYNFLEKATHYFDLSKPQ